jgi:NADH-ubiquinone oxidoreductase chain 5
MASLLLLLGFGGSLDFFFLFSITPLFNDFYLNFFNFSLHYISLISFFLIIGAVGKSAQLGLHT